MSAALTAVAGHAPIGLADLEQSAALRIRVDRKYVVELEQFAALAAALGESHRVLDIDGRRSFRYETVYFDSPGLWSYRAHLQGRRRRYKVRSRRYVESERYQFELKLKGRRGETVKHRLPYAAADHGSVSEAARAFVEDRLARAYPRLEVPALAPTVATSYSRVTLAHSAERLTCDFDVAFGEGGSARPRLAPGYAIVESKSEHGFSRADIELRRLGARPVSCSKYCVGVGLLRDDVKVNELLPLLNAYFVRPDA